MKKIVSIFAALTLLVSMLAFNAAAAADIEFSVTDAEAKPGDIISVDVMVDKNLGTYGMKFWITYDSRCFDLVSVTNGDIFTDSEAELLKEYDDSGEYMYYAESAGFEEDNTKTGVLVTLEFKVLKAAPNGEHKVELDFSYRAHPTNPALDYTSDGFFFSVHDTESRSVEMTKAGIIKVTDSVADPLPETTKKPEETRAPETTKKPSQDSQGGNISGGYVTEIITEFVTDAEGEVVTDSKGEAVVTQVPIAVPEKTPISTEEETTAQGKEPVTEIVYVTDAEGEKVTEPGGEPVTEIVVVEDGNNSLDTAILVISIVAIAAAVALIAFVIISRKKYNKDNKEND